MKEDRPAVVPWQVPWKQPEWKQTSTRNDRRRGKRVDGMTDTVIVGVTSAQVDISELPELLQEKITNVSFPATGKAPVVLFSVSLLATNKSALQQNVASELLLELFLLTDKNDVISEMKKDTNDDLLLASCRLQWPEAIHGITDTQDDKEDDLEEGKTNDDDDDENSTTDPQRRPFLSALQDWFTLSPLIKQIDKVKSSTRNKSKTYRHGVISATMLRRRNSHNSLFLEEDALDTISLMSLGMDSLPIRSTKTTSTTARSVASSKNKSDDEEMAATLTGQIDPPELYLACLTANGLVTIYSPWTLLGLDDSLDKDKDSASSTNPDQEFLDSMATLFLGQDIFSKLEKIWRPLSQPLTTISLSILEQNKLYQQKAKKGNQQHQRALDVSLWNHLVESATFPHRTVSNQATSLTMAGTSYLVVMGSGIPYTQVYHDDDDSSIGERQHLHVEDESNDSWYQGEDANKPAKRRISTDESQDGWNQAESKIKERNDGNDTLWGQQDQGGDDEDFEKLANGGFVTFCSTSQWSETRTLFLPFPPKQVSYVQEWKSMELLLVLGDTQAMAIRMDASPSPVALGSTVKQQLDIPQSSSVVDGRHSPSPNTLNDDFIWINRFQVLPIPFPQTSVRGRLLCGSNMGVQPPALLQLYTEEETRQGLVLQKTLKGVTSLGTIEVSHVPCHVAKIQLKEEESLDKAWSLLGQGWSLFGTNSKLYLMCWEGATTSRGVSFVQELEASTWIHSSISTKAGFVLPVFPGKPEKAGSGVLMPHLKSYESPIEEAIEKRETHDRIIEALESISGLSYRTGENIFEQSSPSPTRRQALTHRQKSTKLLQHCSSWTQLEKRIDKMHRQVPVANVRMGNESTPHFTLTLREIVVENGPASPFQEVLSWLSDEEDYFTAASIALDLLQDAEVLFHLWKNSDKVDEVDEQTKLEGLLDGVIPLEDLYAENKTVRSSTLIQLADMTLACLVKGGFPMSTTLRKFVRQNEYYDPEQACLMLAATAANALSDDPESISLAMGRGVTSRDYDDLLWPVRCLLEVGSTRDYLPTALVLLNVTIPDELRHRAPQAFPSLSIPPNELTEKLVTLILACDENATDLLLDLVDNVSRCRFWHSLDHDIRLVLSLIDIGESFPLLRHFEVRSWVRKELHTCLTSEKAADVNVGEILPSNWLQRLCAGCLQNAGCDLNDLEIESLPQLPPSDHGLEKHRADILRSRNALVASRGSGGLDFDLLIPALLLLQCRGLDWQPGNFMSTQSILDAACYLAGRHDNEEPIYAFDGPTVMRQCALAGNVRAGANLVGGKDGFVLSCCDVLINELEVSMEAAERFFLDESLSMRVLERASTRQLKEESFNIGHAHRHLLWLLDEHVLAVKTFGEFETVHVRGKVDPVFCARSFFRAWLCLSYLGDKKRGTVWLVNYLRKRLGIQDDSKPSSHRLACAALSRALLWTSNDVMEEVLAIRLDIEKRFLIQLAESCSGLVESVPPIVAEKIVKELESKDTLVASGLIFPTSNISV